MLYPYLIPFAKRVTAQCSVAVLYGQTEQKQLWNNVSDKL